MYIMCVPGAPEGQKGVSGVLDPVLQKAFVKESSAADIPFVPPGDIIKLLHV